MRMDSTLCSCPKCHYGLKAGVRVIRFGTVKMQGCIFASTQGSDLRVSRNESPVPRPTASIE